MCYAVQSMCYAEQSICYAEQSMCYAEQSMCYAEQRCIFIYGRMSEVLRKPRREIIVSSHKDH